MYCHLHLSFWTEALSTVHQIGRNALKTNVKRHLLCYLLNLFTSGTREEHTSLKPLNPVIGIENHQGDFHSLCSFLCNAFEWYKSALAKLASIIPTECNVYNFNLMLC